MARAGAKRKSGHREPNGRRSRTEPKERIEGTVLNQPHRRGNTDQKCASVFGRFCLRNKLRTELYDAGEEYASVTRRWQTAKGIPVQVSSPDPSSGLGVTKEVVKTWQTRMMGMERAMCEATANGHRAMRQLLLDQNEIGMDQDGLAIIAAEALAVHLGFMRAIESPFLVGAFTTMSVIRHQAGMQAAA